MLSETQKQQFWNDGVLVVENAVDQEALRALKTTFADWVEQSREHTAPFGETIDGRPRFDVEPGHTAEKPGLRRVNAPVEISQVYFDVMASSRMTDCVAELIGPNVKAHHSKINSKLPGAKTQVKWHQDFPFTPHSNDDLVTALHGSAPNHSDQSRTLFICVYSAEDAVSYSSNPVPNKYEGLVVSGEQTNRVRSVPFDISLPQKPTTASFFDQQDKHGASG